MPKLNDDCLRKIFSYVSVLDLIAVAEVSERFKSIAQSSIVAEYKVFYLRKLEMDARKKNVTLQMEHLNSFLMHFGPVITHLRVRYGVYSPIINTHGMELIATHCSGTLRVLKLEKFTFKRKMKFLRRLFEGLWELRLDECTFDFKFVDMLPYCRQLKKLKIEAGTSRLTYEFLPFNMPALQSISLRAQSWIIQTGRFFQNNPQLKKVSVKHCDSPFFDLLTEIAQFVPQVEKLTCEISWDISAKKHLKELTSLKKLHLYCPTDPIHAILDEMTAAGVPLENLKLHHCPADPELFDSISRIKTLKTLGLFESAGVSVDQLINTCVKLPEINGLILDHRFDGHWPCLVELIQKVPKLREVDLLWSCNVMSDEFYGTLIDAIKKYSQSRPFRITMNYNSDKISKELRHANRNTLVFVQKVSIYDDDDEIVDFDQDEDAQIHLTDAYLLNAMSRIFSM